MEQALKDRWVTALRSGDYEQTNGYLRREDGEGKIGYCCLGVLKDIQGCTWKAATTYNEDEDEDGIFDEDELPDNGDRIFFAEQDHNGEGRILFADHLTTYPNDEELFDWGLGWRIARKLAEMNDGGSDFEEIAAFIEETSSLEDPTPEAA